MSKARLNRLEKLQQLAIPEQNMTIAEKQAIAIREAESLILDGLKDINAKKRNYENLSKIRVQKGITELKEKIKKEKEEQREAEKKSGKVQIDSIKEVSLDYLEPPKEKQFVYQPSISIV